MLINKNTNLGARGFTIVEITMVLAIAGVIMAVVFAAVPQAQRNQRDNARKTVSQRLVSSLENYNANNQGSYPFGGGSGGGPPTDWSDTYSDCSQSPAVSAQSCNEWYTGYVSGKIDISGSCGSPATIKYAATTSSPTVSSWSCTGSGPNNVKPGDIFIGVGDQCNGPAFQIGQNPTVNKDSKQFAMLVALENNGNWYCLDNR